MKAVSNGSRLEIKSLNDNEASNLGEAINLNGVSLSIETRRNRRK